MGGLISGLEGVVKRMGGLGKGLHGVGMSGSGRSDRSGKKETIFLHGIATSLGRMLDGWTGTKMGVSLGEAGLTDFLRETERIEIYLSYASRWR